MRSWESTGQPACQGCARRPHRQKRCFPAGLEEVCTCFEETKVPFLSFLSSDPWGEPGSGGRPFLTDRENRAGTERGFVKSSCNLRS